MNYRVNHIEMRVVEQGKRNAGREYAILRMYPENDFWSSGSDRVTYVMFFNPDQTKQVAMLKDCIAKGNYDELPPFAGKTVIVEDLPNFYRYQTDVNGNINPNAVISDMNGMPIVYNSMKVFVPLSVDGNAKEDARTLALRIMRNTCRLAVNETAEVNDFTAPQQPVNQQVTQPNGMVNNGVNNVSNTPSPQNQNPFA